MIKFRLAMFESDEKSSSRSGNVPKSKKEKKINQLGSVNFDFFLDDGWGVLSQLFCVSVFNI